MTTTRTDVHRPVALVTEDYTYVGTFDNHPPEPPLGGSLDGYIEAMAWWREHSLPMMKLAESGSLGAERGSSQCHHCGAAIRYGATLRHVSGDHIAVGETCLDNRFERATADFQAARKAAELDREKQRIRKAVAAFAEANPDLAFMTLHPTIAQLRNTANDGRHFEVYNAGAGTSIDNCFVADVARKLVNYGDLSQRQIDAVRRSIARDAEKAAKAKTDPEPSCPVVEGRIVVEGTVLTLKWQDGDFGSTLKMLVRDDRGFKVWGTVPTSLTEGSDWDETAAGYIDRRAADRGDRVRFTATVERSRDDEAFGFFKRPVKAEVLA